MISIADHLRQEGREEGRQEGAEASSKEIAKRMLAEGMPFDIIAKLTSLTIDQIKALACQEDAFG